MSDVRRWIAARAPAPPEPLAMWLDDIDAHVHGDGDSVLDGLVDSGLRELDAARAAPGRVRESAFHLLAADALVTYACESALSSPEPESALRDILRKAAVRNR